jgi:hypothetical protein
MELIIYKDGQPHKVLFDDEDEFLIKQYKWHLLKGPRAKTAYAAATIIKNGKIITVLMHRLIMGVDSPEIHVHHKNENGLDNRKENFDPLEIKEHAKLNSVSCGADHYRAKLNEEKVREIRSLYNAGGHSMRQLAKKFNVAYSNVNDILNRKTWKSLD